jgi:hypothetical protein
MITLKPWAKGTIQDILINDINVGFLIKLDNGKWVFEPTTRGGYYDEDTLILIYSKLRELNNGP